MYAFGAKTNTSIGLYMAGGSTVPSDVTVSSTLGTHTYKVKLVGQTVECYFDGVLKITFTDALLTANTKHGLAAYQTTNAKFDNFTVKSV
jgi:hypothetical protein